jgi:hypothetical protein
MRISCGCSEEGRRMLGIVVEGAQEKGREEGGTSTDLSIVLLA